MPHTPLPAPLYQRIYGILYRRIQRGVYVSGAALGSEDELAAEFGVSKATVRQAVGALAERGLVERHQGRGTFVRGAESIHRPHPFVGSFTELITGNSDMTIRDVNRSVDVPFPLDVQLVLKMDVATGAMLDYRRDLKGEPFAYTIIYFTPAVVELIGVDNLNPYDRVTLETQRGMPITGATQSMSAEIADVVVAENLSLDIGQPVLFSERVIMSGSIPAEFIRTWYRGDMFKWQSDLTFTWAGDRLKVSISADQPESPARLDAADSHPVVVE